jgi:hypothetical protein
MADIDSIDPRELSPEEFARMIKDASSEQIDAVLDDPLRRSALLDGVFSRMAGQFRPDSAPARDSAIHWRITGGPNGEDVYETWITGAQGSSTPQCSTSKEPSHDPRVTLTMAADQFLALVSGNSAPTMMFITGKVKLDGDIGFAANLTKIFDMPQA